MQTETASEAPAAQLESDARDFGEKLLFGALFVVVLPALLIAWSTRLDRWAGWRVPRWPAVGISLIACGVALAAISMLTLSAKGEGLPMSAYPPKRLVTQGPYRLIRHPIYAGAMLVAGGIALLTRSAAGLFVTTPVFVASTISYVAGYEGPGLRQRFQDEGVVFPALLSVPEANDERPARGRKLALGAAITASWVVVGYLVDFAGAVEGHTVEWGPYRLLWAAPGLVYFLWITSSRTNRGLRRASVGGGFAVMAGLFAYAVLPPLGLALTSPALRTVFVASTLTAGPLFSPVSALLLRASQSVANSRRDLLLFGGRFRIISHAIFSGLAGAIGVGIGGLVLDNSFAALFAGVLLIVGAGFFAQTLRSSPSLMRPFGYWGAVLGALVAGVAGRFLLDLSVTTMVLACVMAAPFVQAIGRLRCLAQGCCHGLETTPESGIRVWQKQSRVVALSGLANAPILPTQLYSITFNCFLGALLVALFRSHAVPATFIIGMYLVLTGIERFAEDAYRGEKQTRWTGPLRENQWIALVAAISGVAVTFVNSNAPAPVDVVVDWRLGLSMAVGGLLAAFFMSMDFPKATFRYSRLSG